MRPSNIHFEPTQIAEVKFDAGKPWWQDYLPLLSSLAGANFPTAEILTSLLPDGLAAHTGQPIKFIDSSLLQDQPYEQRIFNSGRVSTRNGHWHDLFNALIWMRFPHIKVAMNSLHNRAWEQSSQGSRGQQRDALTLFDECGVIVFSRHMGLLELLANREWNQLFQVQAKRWHKDLHISICGHAMLEKYLAPYKAMTAKALLVQIPNDCKNLDRDELLSLLDRSIADRILTTDLLSKPAHLSPLPLAGIPGCWPHEEQDQGFYADQNVFRPAPKRYTAAPVWQLL